MNCLVWNPTDDYAYVNGHKTGVKCWLNSIPVWQNGQFGIEVENGVYNGASSYTLHAFVVSGNELQSTLNARLSMYTLVSKELINFANYSRIVMKETNADEVILDVSGYSGLGYLCVDTLENNTDTRVVQVSVCSTKENHNNTYISGLLSYKVINSVYSSITEITIE